MIAFKLLRKIFMQSSSENFNVLDKKFLSLESKQQLLPLPFLDMLLFALAL